LSWLRDIAKLDPGVKERIRQALERYAQDPVHYASEDG
jgi:hypothetical protein